MAVDAQHRPDPAVRRGRGQVHGQIELPGELADRGEPHSVSYTHRIRDSPFVQGHAEARVVDGDADTVVHVLQVDHDVRVRRGVPQRVVQQLGDDDRDGFDGVRDQRGARLEVVVDPDPVVAREPGLATGHRVHQMGLLAGQAHPGPAHHGGDLGAPQRLLVLMVQFEQGLRQLGVVVALLQSAQRVLEPVQRGLDLPGGAPHPGLCGGVHAQVLRGQFDAQLAQHVLHRHTERGPGRPELEGARHRDMGVRELAGSGGHALRREVLDLGRERLHHAVEMGPQRGDLVPLHGPLPSRPEQPAAEGERGQGADGQSAEGQVR